MKFYRGDYAPVPSSHVESAIIDVEHHLLDLREQLSQWEGIIIELDEQAPSTGKAAGIRKNKKETSDGTSR